MVKKKAKKKMKAKTAKAAKVKKLPAGQYRRFEEILDKKRDDILKMVKHKEEDLSQGEIGDEADVASKTFERELLFEMEDSERIILDHIEAALRKIEKGNFGICESCGKSISSPRLKAMPWARYCIACQSRVESPV